MIFRVLWGRWEIKEDVELGSSIKAAEVIPEKTLGPNPRWARDDQSGGFPSISPSKLH